MSRIPWHLHDATNAAQVISEETDSKSFLCRVEVESGKKREAVASQDAVGSQVLHGVIPRKSVATK